MGYVLHDVFERKDIHIRDGKIMNDCRLFKIDSTSLPKLGKTQTNIGSRYILPVDKHLIFILQDVDTLEEFYCINNKSIFIQLGKEYNDNEAKYISAIRRGIQTNASVCNRVFRISGAIQRRIKKTKNHSNYVSGVLRIKKRNNKIKSNVSCRINHLLRKINYNGSKTAERCLGCKKDFFIKYIESKFTKNMNWDNRNLWDIDHIKPFTMFDLNNDDELFKAFHYTNLQPIWATSKIAKMMGESDLYKGNKNKNDKDHSYDYCLIEKISHLFPEEDAIEVCKKLFKAGVKKVFA